MNRQIVGDAWFDLETAKTFPEKRYWDGRRMLSKATQTEWDHERLYRTGTGAYVRECYTDYNDHFSVWSQITVETAVLWLIEHGHELTQQEETDVARTLEIRPITLGMGHPPHPDHPSGP